MDTEYYGQVNYPQIQGIDGIHPIAETGSFLVAKCNLLKKLGHSISPPELNDFFADNGTFVRLNDSVRDDLYWDAICTFDPSLKITGMDTGWPTTDNAIVKFHSQSVQQPHVIEDGLPVPNVINHFCVVADHKKKLIIDSYDGEIKEAGPYGTPISHAVYARTKGEPPRKIKLTDADRYYNVVKGGESITEIARKLKIPRIELLDHNQDDIADPSHIPEGAKLHLPYPIAAPQIRLVRYELLDEPQAMHTVKNTRKWNFGNAQTWDDMNTTGYYPQNRNVTILAVAYVPLTENGQEIEAAYYLDGHSLGDYISTGRVRYTTGYSHSDLAPGHADKSTPPPVAEKAIALTPEKLEAKKSEIAQLVATEAARNPSKYPNFFKSTYQPEAEFVECTVVLPEGQDYILVEDYDPEASHNPVKLRHGREIFIAGTFEHGGATYGRPAIEKDGELVASRHWYGIPMDCLVSNHELYNELEKRKLTWFERAFERVLRTAYSPSVQNFVHKNKKKG